jgi:PAS domain S-box-containing protein
LPKLATLPPELAKSIPALRASFGLPEWVFSIFSLLTLIFGIAFVWILFTEHAANLSAFFAQTENLLVALAVSVLALLAAAAWLLWMNVSDKNLLVVQRQAFISNQLSSFDSARDPIILIHRSGRIELANLAAESLFGQSRSDLHGRDLSILLEIDATSRDLPNRLLLSAAELKAGVVRELWGRNGNGERFPVEATLRNMAAGDGPASQ